MAREDQHQQKAERNEQFAESLNRSDPTQESWAVVAAFYSALHYVQAYFSHYSIDAGTHDERFTQIKSDAKLRSALASYKYLYTLSRTARYHCTGLPAEPYLREAKPRLVQVKNQVKYALSVK